MSSSKSIVFKYTYATSALKQNTVTVFGETATAFVAGQDYDENVVFKVPSASLSSFILYYNGVVPNGTVGSSELPSLRTEMGGVSTIPTYISTGQYKLGDIVSFTPTGSTNASCYTLIRTTSVLSDPIPLQGTTVASYTGPVIGQTQYYQAFVQGLPPVESSGVAHKSYWAQSTIASGWTAGVPYYSGDRVVYQGNVYQCITTNGLLDTGVTLLATFGTGSANTPYYGYDKGGIRYILDVLPTNSKFWLYSSLPAVPTSTYAFLNWSQADIGGVNSVDFSGGVIMKWDGTRPADLLPTATSGGILGGSGTVTFTYYTDDELTKVNTLLNLYNQNQNSFSLVNANAILGKLPASVIKSQTTSTSLEADKQLAQLVYAGPQYTSPSSYNTVVQSLFEEAIANDMLYKTNSDGTRTVLNQLAIHGYPDLLTKLETVKAGSTNAFAQAKASMGINSCTLTSATASFIANAQYLVKFPAPDTDGITAIGFVTAGATANSASSLSVTFEGAFTFNSVSYTATRGSGYTQAFATGTGPQLFVVNATTPVAIAAFTNPTWKLVGAAMTSFGGYYSSSQSITLAVQNPTSVSSSLAVGLSSPATYTTLTGSTPIVRTTLNSFSLVAPGRGYTSVPNIIVSGSTQIGGSLPSFTPLMGINQISTRTGYTGIPVTNLPLRVAIAPAATTTCSDLSHSGGISTLTVASLTGFAVGDVITTTGFLNSGNNGTFTIASIPTGGALRLTYANASGAAGSTGTVTKGTVATANPVFYGSITSIPVTYGGSGYLLSDKVTISAPYNGVPPTTSTSTVSSYAVASVTLSNGGSGYTTAPTVSFSGGAGSGVSAYATVASGIVTSVVVTNFGSGYTVGSAPSVTFTPTNGGTGATGTAVLSYSTGINTAVTVSNGGTGFYTTPTVVVSAPNIGATATTTLANTGVVGGFTVVTGGAGYIHAPYVSISAPPTQATAIAVAVVNSVTSQVTDITIVNPGVGYTTAPTITISSSGSGAVSAVSSGVLTITGWTGTNVVGTYQVVLSGGTFTGLTNGGIYTVTAASGSPTTSVTISSPGSLAGTGTITIRPASATVVVSNGSVVDIQVTNPGFGYTRAATPSVTFTAPPQSVRAQARPVISSTGVVTSVDLVNTVVGFDTTLASYTVAPTSVTITAPGTAPGTTVGLSMTNGVTTLPVSGSYTGAAVSVGDRFTLTGFGGLANGGTFTALTGTTSTSIVFNNSLSLTNTGTITKGIQATATAAIVSGSLVLTIVNPGFGYISGSAPTVTLSGGTGSGTVTALIGTGGIGYTSAPTATFLTVTSFGGSTSAYLPTLTRATAVATINNDAFGTVASVLVTNAGSGYTAPPTLTFTASAGRTAQASLSVNTAGAITNIVMIDGGYGYGLNVPGQVGPIVTITNAGSGYLAAPTVSFTGGAGSGAAATATVSGGAVTSVTITNPGSGYTSAPTIVFTPTSGGTLAAATAVLTTSTSEPVTVSIVSSGGSGATLTNFLSTGTLNTFVGSPVMSYTLDRFIYLQKGSGYLSSPSCTVTNYSGSAYTATSLSLVPKLSVVSIPTYKGVTSIVPTGTVNSVAVSGIGTCGVGYSQADALAVVNNTAGYLTLSFSGGTPTAGAAAVPLMGGVVQRVLLGGSGSSGGTVNGPTGSGYTVGQNVIFSAPASGQGSPASGIVSSVNSSGGVTGITLTSGGFGYGFTTTGGAYTAETITVTIAANVTGNFYVGTNPVDITYDVIGFGFLGNSYGQYATAPTVAINSTSIATQNSNNAIPTTYSSKFVPMTGATASLGVVPSPYALNAFAGVGLYASPQLLFDDPPQSTTALVDATVANESVTGFTITNSGYGYDFVPTVTITGYGTGAAASAVMGVTQVFIASGGAGYSVGNILTLTSPDSGLTATVKVTQVDVYGKIMNTFITAAGSGYTSSPAVYSVKTSNDATVTPTTVANLVFYLGVVSFTLSAGGAAYSGVPSVVVQSPSFTSSTATATAKSARITKFTITTAGSGYTQWQKCKLLGGATHTNPVTEDYGYLLVTSAGGTLSGAKIGNTVEGTLNTSGGSIGTVTITNGGSGYSASSPPSVSFAGGGGSGAAATVVVNTSGVVTGLVFAANETSYGSGYTGIPTVTIEAPPNGRGVTATAVATLDGGFDYRAGDVLVVQGGVGGTITVTGVSSTIADAGDVSITNYGSGYVTAPAITTYGGAQGIVLATSLKLYEVQIASVTNNGLYNDNDGVFANIPGSGIIQVGKLANTATTPTVTLTNAVSNLSSFPAITVSGSGTGAGLAAVATSSISTTAGSYGTVTSVAIGSSFTVGSTTTFGAVTGTPATQQITFNSVNSSLKVGMFITLADSTKTGTGPFAVSSIVGNNVTILNTNATGTSSGSLNTNATVVGGAYYSSTSKPTVTFSAPPTAVAAVATATLSGTGSLSALVLTNAGRGYIDVPGVYIADPNGSGGNVTFTRSLTTGGALVLTMTGGGSGFSTIPTITIDAPPASASAQGEAIISGSGAGGRVTGVTVTSGGSGYETAPTVTFSTPSLGSIVAYANCGLGSVQITSSVAGFVGNASVYTSAPSGPLLNPTQALIVPLKFREITGFTGVTNAGVGQTDVYGYPYDKIPLLAISAPALATTATEAGSDAAQLLAEYSNGVPFSTPQFQGWYGVQFNAGDTFQFLVKYTIAKAVVFQVDTDVTIPGLTNASTSITIGGVTIPLYNPSTGTGVGRELSTNALVHTYMVTLKAS